jgi:hypothetical protein
VALLVAAGCSDDDGGDEADRSSTTTTAERDGTTTTARPRPDGPAADVSEELTGGEGPFVGSADPTNIGEGYVQTEFVAAGTASTYEADGELTEDGMWSFEPTGTADYRTRIVVRAPDDPEAFSGTVLLEWMNVSGGVDADPEFVSLREEIVRQGHVWVGVTAQAIGVEGGPVAVRVDVPGAEDAGKGLKAIDPERYGSLSHPGDAYAFDIYTQVARAIRAGEALGGLEPLDVVAVGESQSAFALTTYVNGVQPSTEAFDGFFIHSRGASPLPLAKPGEAVDISASLGGGPTRIRTDIGVPVFTIQTETDVVGLFGTSRVRQPDTDTFRLWEVAGTAHADLHLVGESTAEVIDCGVPINDGPFHLVAKAAFRHFVGWVAGGEPPPSADPIEVSDDAQPVIERDEDGIALGGVRTPPVDVPTRVLSGEKGPSDDVICLLSGSTPPMPADRLAVRYRSREDFQQQFDAAADEAIDAGFVLEEDREALGGYAHPELVDG